MNNNDFNYYNKTKNIKNNTIKSNNNINTIKLNSNNLEKKHTTMYDTLFNTLDYFNPFNIEGIENQNTCIFDSVDSISKEIQNIRDSGKSLDEQNIMLDNYIQDCGEQYSGINSLINMDIIDVMKNEKQGNNLLKSMFESITILQDNISKSIIMITPYQATGIHPIDLFQQEFPNQQIPTFGECEDLCNKHFQNIVTKYGNIYGEEPSEFKHGIPVLLDSIRTIKKDASISHVLECQAFIHEGEPWKTAREALELNNLVRDPNSYFADGKMGPLASNSPHHDAANSKLLTIRNNLESISKDINNVGGSFYNYVENLLTDFSYLNDASFKKAKYFLQFPNGTSPFSILKEKDQIVSDSQTKGLINLMLALQETFRHQCRLKEFINAIRNHYLTVRDTNFSDYDENSIKEFIKNNIEELGTIIDSYINDTNFSKIIPYDSNSLKNLITFNVPDNLTEFCYNLTKVNSYTGKTYESCPSYSIDIDYANDIFFKNGLKRLDGRTLGIYQTPINSILIYMSRLNRIYCLNIKHKLCPSIISESELAEMNAEYDSVRDLLNEQSDHASAHSISTSNNTTTASNAGIINESFTNMKEGFEGNRHMIDGKNKFSGSVSNILQDYTNVFGGKEQTLQQYTDDKINVSNCNPINMPYFSATYKCGNVMSNNPLSNLTASEIAQFNCANPENEKNDLYDCNLFYLILNDDGTVNIKRNNDSNQIMYSWDPEIDESEKIFIISAGMNESSLNPKNVLYGGETLNPGDFLSSPNKTYNLLNENGSLKLQYKLSPCFRNNENNNYGYYSSEDGNYKSIGIYHVDDVNISHIGKAGHVNLNGELQLYETPKFSDAYISVGNYATSHHNNMNEMPTNDDQIINRNGAAVMYSTSSPETCGKYCNEFDDCGGYIISEGNCMLKSDKMFPKGLRIPSSNSNMYIRMRGFKSDDLHESTKPIKDEKSNMTNFKLNEYENSGNLLSGYRQTTDPSDIVEATTLYYEEYEKRKQELISAKQELDTTLKSLNAEEIEVLKQYNINVDTMQQNITKQEEIQKHIYNKVNGINTLETAEYDVNTNVNQNLKYMFVYSALTVGFLGATFALI